MSGSVFMPGQRLLYWAMIEILPIPAFLDNYIWLISNGEHAVVVDPGDAAPVTEYLTRHHLTLSAIMITHHHSDHIGGVKELQSRHDAAVYAPARGNYEFAHIAVAEGDRVALRQLDLEFSVIEVPGHTLDHVAYYCAPLLFCGDTLFSCGCGRLFEGTASQLYQSLQRLASLPPETLVYCTHEYTARNIAFARELDPHNIALKNRQEQVTKLRSNHCPSLPSTIAQELESNPYLRCHAEAIIKASKAPQNAGPEQVFALIRNMRNLY